MRVLVAGATGAIGRRLVPALRGKGYEVVATTRSADKAAALRSAGVETVEVDALDRGAVAEALARTKPEVVIHQLTELAGVSSLRNFDREFAGTNLLRTRGTDNLLEGARAAGVRRFIAQSYGGWPYDATGDTPKTEADPLDPDPPRKQRKSLEAIRHLEQAVVGARELEGIALRYGNFYGPGTAIAPDGDLVALVRKRALPVIGGGAGVWSFIHVDDAAAATIAAIERGTPGVYNIVDDDPAPVAVWLPELARVLGAGPPRRVPVLIGRIAAGEVAVHMMSRIRGASNEKARRELGWAPRHASWRDGFRAVLVNTPEGE
jgi:nucleoside-diphosphate-sugar epimerase